MAKSKTPVDPLSAETSASIKISTDGASGKTNSRFVAALDRLSGNYFDKWNAGLEDKAKIQRAKTDAEVKIIETLSNYAAERIKNDPQLAERALNSHYKGIFQQQENIEAILFEANEQLKLAPPQEDKPDEPDKLNERFLNRYHSYAKEASTEELRQQWARVLVSEVRKPGTFSNKVLRTIDEVDQNTASKFQKFCENRIGNIIPKHLSGNMQFMEIQNLVSAGLLIDPGAFGQENKFFLSRAGNGEEFLTLSSGNYAIGFPKAMAFDIANLDNNFNSVGDDVGIKVYVLTEIGLSISLIFEYSELLQLKNLRDKFLESNFNLKVNIYKKNGEQFLLMP